MAELNALRVLIDSVLVANAQSCLDCPSDRDVVATDLVEVLTEYLRSAKFNES